MSQRRFNTKQVTDFWITEADEALQVAENLVASQDYSYALFFGHLAIEKLLKAMHAYQLGAHAPPVHNLVGLASKLNLELSQSRTNTLAKITAFNIQARYPDFKRRFRKKCTPDYTARQMKLIRSTYKWLRSQLP